MKESKTKTAAGRLVDALVEAWAPGEMINKASEGYYGDLTSPLACPITQLIVDARKAGLKGIAKAAMNGDFDGQ